METPFTVTAPGVVVGTPHVHQADRYHGGLGEYHMRLRLAVKDALPLIAQIEAQLQEFIDERTANGQPTSSTLAPYPYKPEGESFLFSFKRAAATGRLRGKQLQTPPAIYDESATAKSNIRIVNGSLVRVSFHSAPYYSNLLVGCGVKLDMVAIQALANYKTIGRAVASHGFAE
jgi:hypothetical protein